MRVVPVCLTHSAADMHVLKTFLHDLPVLPSNVQAANSLLPVQPRTASKQYLKLLKKQMEQIEMFSKVRALRHRIRGCSQPRPQVLSTPPELLVNNYKGLIGEVPPPPLLLRRSPASLPSREARRTLCA